MARLQFLSQTVSFSFVCSWQIVTPPPTSPPFRFVFTEVRGGPLVPPTAGGGVEDQNQTGLQPALVPAVVESNCHSPFTCSVTSSSSCRVCHSPFTRCLTSSAVVESNGHFPFTRCLTSSAVVESNCHPFTRCLTSSAVVESNGHSPFTRYLTSSAVVESNGHSPFTRCLTSSSSCRV